MLLALLYIFTESLERPLICIHGWGGILTEAVLTDQVSYCPKGKDVFRIYDPDEEIYQNYPDCITYFLEVSMDSNKHVYQNPNFTMRVPSFLEGDFYTPFTPLSKYLQNRKYTINQNLFSFTYNWFLYPIGIPDIFTKLRSIVEKAHKESGKKVVILGHSFGTHVIRQFVTHAMTESWVKEHIDGLIFSAPAFFGCAGPFDCLVQGQFSILPKTEYSTRVTRKMPSIYAMFPNYNVFDAEPIFRNIPNIGDIKSSQIHSYFKKIGYITEEGDAMFEMIESSLQEFPEQIPVRSFILYNSGLEAVIGYEGENFTKITGRGDGICQSSSPEYVCKKWKNAECFDWNRNNNDFNHDNMLQRIEEMDKIYEFLTRNNENDDKGKKRGTSFYVSLGVMVTTGVILVVLAIVFCVLKKKTSNPTMKESLIEQD